MLLLNFDPQIGVWCEDPESLEKLRSNFFGTEKGGRLVMDPEEALYILIFQNGVVKQGDRQLGFNHLASFFVKEDPRLIIKYNVYRDWRDRGLILKRLDKVDKQGSKSGGYKKYPAKQVELPRMKGKLFWYRDSMFSIMESEGVGKELFEKIW